MGNSIRRYCMSSLTYVVVNRIGKANYSGSPQKITQISSLKEAYTESYSLDSSERNDCGVVSIHDLQDIASDSLIDFFRGTVVKGVIEQILLYLRCAMRTKKLLVKKHYILLEVKSKVSTYIYRWMCPSINSWTDSSKSTYFP